jgi:peptidyl-tRNA hydrolase, PTH1 family
MPQSSPWLVVGLGNPGDKYARHRHNVGFMVADFFASRCNLGPFSAKHKGELASGEISGQKVLVLKPQTFMNLSGESVAKTVSFFSVPMFQVIALHDEVELDFGKVKVKTGGGLGGHNGLRSMTAQLKTQDYLRLRLGIGRSAPKGVDITNHVLNDFSKSERQVIDADVLPLATTLLETIILQGFAAAEKLCK